MPATEPISKSASPPKFNNSLARTVVVTLLVLSLVPALLITGFTYLRARALLQQQASRQLETIVSTYGKQLEDLALGRQKLLQQTFTDPANQSDITALLTSADNEIALRLARLRLNDLLNRLTRSPGEANFDNILILSEDGKILLSSNVSWMGADILPIPQLKDVIGKSTSSMVYDMAPFYPSQMLVLSTYFFQVSDQGPSVTIVGAMLNPLPQSLLSSASSLFTSGEAYYFTTDNDLIGLSQDQSQVIPYKAESSQSSQISELRKAGKRQSVSIEGGSRPLLAYANWMPVLHTGMIVAVPEEVAFERIRNLLPTSAILLLAALLITGVVIYVGTTRVVNPLTQLAQKADQFANGDWTQRAEVTRSDEIGLLAHTFNKMVEELTALYRSLEGKVDERTRQLRTASEVAQVATSVNDRQEMLRKTVDLLTERFGYHYASVYLIDETGKYAVLQEVASVSEEAPKLKGIRIPVSQQNAVGRVAATLEPFISGDTTTDSAVQGRSLLARTRSQVILPIAIGQQVFGVMDVQSAQPHAFDHDTVAVLQSLAGQIASGLRNILVLASTQVNLEETALLALASRQVTQSQSANEAVKILTETLAKTGYVTVLFQAAPDHLDLLALHDTKGYSIDSGLKGIHIPLPSGTSRMSDGSLIIANQMKGPAEFENLYSFMTRRDCRSLALIPILQNEQVDYVIVLGTRERRQLTDTNLQPYLNLCEVTGNTLERFSMLETLQKRMFELDTMKAVNQIVSFESQLDHLMDVLHEHIVKRIGSDISLGAALYHPDSNLVEIPYLLSGSERLVLDPFPLGEGFTSLVIRQKKPLLITQDTEKAAQEMGVKVVGRLARSWMGVPLIAGGDILGALIIQDLFNENRFTEEDLNLFTSIAPQIANTIRNARLLDEMQHVIEAYDQEKFLLNTLLVNIPERVYFKDREGQYIRVSQSFAQQAGIENLNEVPGKLDIDIYGQETGLEVFETDQEVILSGEAEIGKIEKESVPGGSDVWLLTSKIPMTDSSGERVGLLGLAQDITDLKAVEQLTELRAQHLQTASEIARDTTGSLEVDEILRRAVELIRARFGFYHASIFLVDNLGEYAALRESSGEIGERMKQTGHRLAVGSQSLVGQATGTAQPVVVNQVRKDPNYYPNPLLPDTQAEMVIPLKAGERVLGALDVQSVHANAFSEEDVHTLQILSDQLAVAVMNADLFSKMQEHLSKHRLLHEITSAATAAGDMNAAMQTVVDGLRSSLGGERAAVYYRNENGLFEARAMAGFDEPESQGKQYSEGKGIIGLVVQEKQPIRVNDTRTETRYALESTNTRSFVAVPILFLEDVMGVLLIESDRPTAFDENDQEILGTLGTSLGAIIANAHLISRVRLQTERQKQLFEITSKIRRSVDIETILKTSATELAKALQASRAQIEISTDIQPAALELDPPLSTNLDSDYGHNGHKGHNSHNGNGHGSNSNGKNGKGKLR